MKLPSVNQILQGALRTFFRFPLVLLSAVVGTVCALILVDYEGPEAPTILFPILFAAILEIPLLLGLALVAEKINWSRTKSLALQLAGVLVLVGYAFTVPTTLSAGPAYHAQRLLLLAIAAHLFVSVGPFLKKGEENGFWHYNKTLLFRILGAALYTHILYLGLTLALAALDQLFGMDIPGKRYGELWIVTFGILNTWLFLAGIPEDLNSFDTMTEYPKSLRILVHYALAPLAIIYVVIVYAYIAKIVVTWEWSEGWISKLILGFSVTGFLSLLLLYPVSDRDESGWVRPAFRWFYWLMIPPVIVFPFALWRRISEFGITEARYGAAVIAAWLIFVVIYFLLSKTKSIKVIPATLALLAVAVSYGPWGMFQVSEQSQTERLRDLLERNSILVDGRIKRSSVPLAHGDSKEISSTIEYLREIHGLDGIQPWFGESLKKEGALGWKDPVAVADMMGVEYVRVWRGGGGFATFSVDLDLPVDVNGYDRLVRLQFMDRGQRAKDVKEDALKLEFSKELDTLAVTRMSELTDPTTIRIAVLPVVVALVEKYKMESVGNVAPENMVVSGEAKGMGVKVLLRSIQVQRRGERIVISNVSADVLYSVNKSIRQ